MVTDQQRALFIDLVQHKKMPIREAAQISNIGYENAKIINRTYIKDGRSCRFTTKKRVGETLHERQKREHKNRKLVQLLDDAISDSSVSKRSPSPCRYKKKLSSNQIIQNFLNDDKIIPSDTVNILKSSDVWNKFIPNKLHSNPLPSLAALQIDS